MTADMDPSRFRRWLAMPKVVKIYAVLGALVALPVAVLTGVAAGIAGEVVGGQVAGDFGAMAGTLTMFGAVSVTILCAGMWAGSKLGSARHRRKGES